MAMVVQHNLAAQLALGELRKNNDKLGKSLEKVSSGQKINSAKDDAASFCISEKMREQIRTLQQDNQNVQNGSALIKTAEGGINNIVEELRSLKELAVNAANDTNTDIDRATIQKVFTQKMANINDIATTTNYNGKTLIDGTYGRHESNEILFSGITKNFTPLSGTYEDGLKTSGAGYPVTSSYSANGGTGLQEVYADFSNITGNAAANLNGKGFSILCGGCDQYINIIFDASTNDSTYNADLKSELSQSAREYIIGIKDISDANDIPRALFEGIRDATVVGGTDFRDASADTATSVSIDSRHDLRIKQDSSDPTKYYFSKQSPPLQFYDGVLGNVSDLKTLTIHHGPKANQAIKIFFNDMHTDNLGTGNLLGLVGDITNESDEARYEALSYDRKKQMDWLQTLADASGKSLDDISVTTQKNANVAIRVVDGAIERALNESVRVGAYLQRLEYTDANITTMGENIQSAESIIRDADMAKEMTEYTKNNVLTQSAQAMLAQANQNSSGVLSLLQ